MKSNEWMRIIFFGVLLLFLMSPVGSGFQIMLVPIIIIVGIIWFFMREK